MEGIKQFIEELLKVKTYLIKIGSTRRRGEILEKKLAEANVLKLQFEALLHEISCALNVVSDEETLRNIYRDTDKFEKIYKEIILLCKKENETSGKMDFDLKVALNLLPVMTDELSNTKQLIDGVEYYNSVLKKESTNNLIAFILKSRLSQSAKLKLEQNYDTVSDLLKDMKERLLPKKSASAIQKQMMTLKQNDLSIDEFGKKLSEMFVDLTISQSENNSNSFDVLKPLNERQAIKQFAEGLRSRRLGTVITARNYTSLKDAIQAAVDEDAPSTQATELFTIQRNNNNRNFRARTFRNQRGAPFSSSSYQQRGAYSSRGRGYANTSSGRGWRGQPSGRGYMRPRRGRYTGNSNNYFNRGRRPEQIHVLESDNNSKCIPENQFFRD